MLLLGCVRREWLQSKIGRTFVESLCGIKLKGVRLDRGEDQSGSNHAKSGSILDFFRYHARFVYNAPNSRSITESHGIHARF